MDGDKFDKILTRLGTGRWNIMYFVASGFWYFMWAPMGLSGVYLAPVIAHTCLPPPNVTKVAEDSCSYVRETEDGTEVEEPCTEWLFDTSIYTNTLTSEFQLVCDRAYLRPTYQSSSTLANIFTQVLWGYVADRYGRKMLTLPTHLIMAVTSVTISLLPSFSLVLACRVLLGSMTNATLYLYAMEVCEVKQRSTVGILIGLPWAIGTMAWGGLAYLIRDWRRLNLVGSLPMLLIVLVAFLDESPRWLAVVGQKERAKTVLRRAARMNKVQLPPDEELKQLLTLQDEPQRSLRQEGKKGRLRCGLPRLVSTPVMRIAVITVFVAYFCTTLVFTGLNLSGASLSADPFLYMVLGGLMEVPGDTLAAPIISRLGRKVPIILGFLLCGVTLIALAFVPSDMSWLVLALAMTGKLAVSGAYMILVVYQAELLPTEVRLQGKGVALLSGSIGFCLAPYITDLLVPIVPWLPSVLFGMASLAVCVLLLPLPETQGVALPQTVADFEVLWKRKWLSGKMDIEV